MFLKIDSRQGGFFAGKSEHDREQYISGKKDVNDDIRETPQYKKDITNNKLNLQKIQTDNNMALSDKVATTYPKIQADAQHGIMDTEEFQDISMALIKEIDD